ncbi:MAG: hypothetical protein GX577_03035 [Leptolinea sp.]|nr:hypothetical protein [Leptolinea sp.]
MPLDVLIATPSGPFGELIRLSLEADPQFKCAIINNSSEIYSALKNAEVQVVIFDCSFQEIDPGDIVELVKTKSPAPVVLFVPPENRPDNNALQRAHPDGLITRPFDASVLPDQVLSAINKKSTRPLQTVPAGNPSKNETWWSVFQSGIKETAASNGLVVQNGLIIASTPGTSTALQQQVNASVMRFWNPKDSADLMRYVKDLVTGQEWMMYATHAADNAVLVLLFLPQTPITKVRSQTIKLARDVSAGMTNPRSHKPEDESLETSEPPRLHEILSEEQSLTANRGMKKEFPVEWFKEADLHAMNAGTLASASAPEVDSAFPSPGPERLEEFSPGQDEPSYQNLDTVQAEELKAFEASLVQNSEPGPASPDDLSLDGLDFFATPLEEKQTIDTNIKKDVTQDNYSEITDLDVVSKTTPPVPETEPETSSQQEILFPIDHLRSGANQNDLDLGIFEELYLHSNPDDETGLDTMQPIPLDVSKPKTDVFPGESQELPIEGGESIASSDFAPTEDQSKDIGDQKPYELNREPLFDLSGSFPVETPPAPETGTADEVAPETAYAPMPVDQASEQFDRESETNSDVFPEEDYKPEKLFPEVDDSSSPIESPHESQRIFSNEESIQQIESAPTSSDLYSRMTQLESAEAVIDRETYTVALIPREEKDILLRQLAGTLNQAITRLCLALNWELINLTIRPTYMQLTIAIPQTLPQENMISIIRKETTQEIGKIDPDRISSLKGEDFWAPQSMSAAGKDFTPSIHWQNFILRRNPSEIA